MLTNQNIISIFSTSDILPNRFQRMCSNLSHKVFVTSFINVTPNESDVREITHNFYTENYFYSQDCVTITADAPGYAQIKFRQVWTLEFVHHHLMYSRKEYPMLTIFKKKNKYVKVWTYFLIVTVLFYCVMQQCWCNFNLLLDRTSNNILLLFKVNLICMMNIHLNGNILREGRNQERTIFRKSDITLLLY